MSLARKLLRGASTARGPATLIDRTTGTNIGDMTGSGGLAAAFDGTTNQIAANCAGKNSVASSGSAYAGKQTAVPTAIERATFFGSNNGGYIESANPSTTITLYGKQGSAPSIATDGTLLGSITFTDTANESTGRTINSSDVNTYWDYLWGSITHTDGTARSVRLAEIQMTGWI